MGAEYDTAPGWDLVQFIDKKYPLLMKFIDNIFVMNYFTPDINWLTIDFKRQVYDPDGSDHPCTESARGCQDYSVMPQRGTLTLDLIILRFLWKAPLSGCMEKDRISSGGGLPRFKAAS
jgi:hypothetical protein